jgi:hypothetical protein
MPHAEVAIVPGSYGGFNRIDELNDRIAAFIQAQSTDKQAAEPGPPTARGEDGTVQAKNRLTEDD